MTFGARERHAVVALGGNALLRCGEPLEAANQARAVREATVITRIVVHGDDPRQHRADLNA